jgi:hypothetical protein
MTILPNDNIDREMEFLYDASHQNALLWGNVYEYL